MGRVVNWQSSRLSHCGLCNVVGRSYLVNRSGGHVIKLSGRTLKVNHQPHFN